jgi:Flp pilus assembly protein TadD
MEPPYWYYPVRQSLGAALLAAGRAADAERVFRTTLLQVPNNGWALFGLKETLRQRGRDVEATAIEGQLHEAWAGEMGTLSLNRL